MLNLLNKVTGKKHYKHTTATRLGLARIIQRSQAIESDEFLMFFHLSLRLGTATGCRAVILAPPCKFRISRQQQPALALTGSASTLMSCGLAAILGYWEGTGEVWQKTGNAEARIECRALG
jgi:hypothetical protein